MREPTVGLVKAARLIGVSPATLDAWRRQGLLLPSDDDFRFSHARIVDARALALLATDGQDRDFSRMGEVRAKLAKEGYTLSQVVAAGHPKLAPQADHFSDEEGMTGD